MLKLTCSSNVWVSLLDCSRLSLFSPSADFFLLLTSDEIIIELTEKIICKLQKKCIISLLLQPPQNRWDVSLISWQTKEENNSNCICKECFKPFLVPAALSFVGRRLRCSSSWLSPLFCVIVTCKIHIYSFAWFMILLQTKFMSLFT